MRRAVAVGVVALIAASVFVAAHLHMREGVSGFVQANTRNTDASLAPDELKVADSGYGYDGQFMYRLALKPWSTENRVDGVELDQPRYRHSRIGYPALAWAVSGGQRSAVPWALIVVNVVALGAVATLGGLLALDMGRSRWWGLAFAAAPGFVAALARNLSEITAGAFVLAAVLALRRDRYGWAAVSMTCAVLTRETTLLLPVGLLAVLCVQMLRSRAVRPPAAVALVPLAVFAVWQLVLRAAWPGANDERGQNLAWPGKGILDVVRRSRSDGPYDDIELALIVGLLIITAAAAVSMREGLRHYEVAAWALFAVLAMSASIEVWHSWWSGSRATTELYLLSIAAIVSAGRRAAPVLLVVAGMVGLATVQALVLWPDVMPAGAI